MSNFNFENENLYDSIRLNVFEQMNERSEELLVDYPRKDEIPEENRKKIELVERLEKYYEQNKSLPMLQVIRELYRITKDDLPFEKFFKYDESIFDKNGKFTNDILDQALKLYCEFIGINRSLYRDSEYDFLIKCLKHYIDCFYRKF
jgi:hypothetical protein